MTSSTPTRTDRTPAAKTELRSERLDAERPSLQDHLDFIVALNADPEIARWQWLGEPQTPEQARALLEDKIEHWEKHGFGQWIWRERESGDPVGRAGIQWTVATGELVVEVGWSVLSSKQGRGYATEAARAALRDGFERAGCEEIVSFTWTENLASLRVMEKLGMRLRGDFVLEGLPHRLYAISAADLPQAK